MVSFDTLLSKLDIDKRSDSDGAIHFEEVLFAKTEHILLANEVKIQTFTIVEKIVERYLDPLVEGMFPLCVEFVLM